MIRNFPLIQSTLIAGCVVLAASAVADVELIRSTIDGGGVVDSSGGEFAMSATIGQPDAGSMAGGDFKLTGGFWFPLAQGDCNVTGNVDLIDFDDLAACLTGPGQTIDPECACYDINGDDGIDLFDLASFQLSFTGP